MTWRESLLLAVYPELREYPLHERRAALQRAREGAFDTVEWVGLLISVGLVAFLTRYTGGEHEAVRLLGIAVADFFLALALLAIVGGPFLRRRTRRHLRARGRMPDVSS